MFYDEILQYLLAQKHTKASLSKLKLKLSKKYGLKKIPTDIDILLHTSQEDLPKVVNVLRTKPTRTISGVATIAAMTKPYSCPHGTCTYCPGGPKSKFNSPQSYTGKEPSTMRAARNNYDPYLITFNRLEQYIATGNVPDKVEFIVQGGTFPAMGDYQDEFIRYAFKAMNDFSTMFFPDNKLDILSYKEFFELPGSVHDEDRAQRIRKKCLELKKECILAQEQEKNESSKIRCVALCVETKPDWCLEPHINEMLRLGTTRVEVGVQCLRDDILKATNRGHTMKETYLSSQLLKDSFLKVCYHMMPGLPGSTISEDIEMFKTIFDDERLRPDALKIYPCMVMPGTALEVQWKKGKFTPLTTQQAADIITKAQEYIAPYCRVMRVQRDIPSTVVSAGVDKTNLRQYVEGIGKDIRAREVGHVFATTGKRPTEIKIITTYYESSGGEEAFIEAKDPKQDILIGFCRLRKPYKPFRPEITPDSVGIRELHVYGDSVPIGEDSNGSHQHKGWGEKLLKEAEKIAKTRYKAKKILVISGIGVRNYYRKFGYEQDGIYMSKNIK